MNHVAEACKAELNLIDQGHLTRADLAGLSERAAREIVHPMQRMLNEIDERAALSEHCAPQDAQQATKVVCAPCVERWNGIATRSPVTRSIVSRTESLPSTVGLIGRLTRCCARTANLRCTQISPIMFIPRCWGYAVSVVRLERT